MLLFGISVLFLHHQAGGTPWKQHLYVKYTKMVEMQEAMILPDSTEEQPPPPESEPESSGAGSDAEEDMGDGDLPPGPLDPEQCVLSGPGFTGGAAGAPVSFTMTSKDSRGSRLREGGAYVVVTVTPGSQASAAGASQTLAPVKDMGDGTYVATYAVSSRGDYQVGKRPLATFLLFSAPQLCHTSISAPDDIILALILNVSRRPWSAECRDKRLTDWRVTFPCFLQSPGGEQRTWPGGRHGDSVRKSSGTCHTVCSHDIFASQCGLCHDASSLHARLFQAGVP